MLNKYLPLGSGITYSIFDEKPEEVLGFINF
jgi:hypothetical protein